eukprot:gene2062-6685_t
MPAAAEKKARLMGFGRKVGVPVLIMAAAAGSKQEPLRHWATRMV